jgi:RNA recognition motif-containing protein
VKKIVVGNLPETVTHADLLALFSQYGEVASARVVKNADPALSRCVAYVEMPPDFAQRAIEGLNGYEFRTSELVVSSAGTSRPLSSKTQKAIRGGAKGSFARHA